MREGGEESRVRDAAKSFTDIQPRNTKRTVAFWRDLQESLTGKHIRNILRWGEHSFARWIGDRCRVKMRSYVLLVQP
jgi:hypothetical protein